MTKDWVHGVGHSPVCQILLQIVVRVVITSSPPVWTSSCGMLSTQADFPFFNDCIAASTSLRRVWWSSSVSVWVQFSTAGSPLALYGVHEDNPCPLFEYDVHEGDPCPLFEYGVHEGNPFPLFGYGVHEGNPCPLFEYDVHEGDPFPLFEYSVHEMIPALCSSMVYMR